MYAKLAFPSTVTAGQAIRDIVRLIRDSGTGTASLANLQYITVGSSELVAGTNSGWSIHSSTPLNTGAQSITDNRYILQGTCANGVAKYVGIYANFDWTNSGSWSSTSTCGFVLGAVQDPGTATVWYGSGNSSTSTTGTKNNCIWPNDSTLVAGGNYNCTIYIFADPRRIIIIGVEGLGYHMMHSSLEFAPTTVSTNWKGLPPVAYFRQTPVAAYTSSHGADATAFGFRGSTLDNNTTQGVSASFLQFPGSMWSVAANGVLRSMNMWHGQASTSSYHDPKNAFKVDGSTNGAVQTATTIVGFGVQWSVAPSYLYNETIDKEFWGCGFMVGNSGDRSSNYWSGARRHYDGSGNVALPLHPIIWKDLNTTSEYFNFSSVSNLYWTLNGQGQRNDTVTVGADVWHYFPTSPSTYVPALVVKRT